MCQAPRKITQRTDDHDRPAAPLVIPEGCVAFHFEGMLCFVLHDVYEEAVAAGRLPGAAVDETGGFSG